ncbi:hypothetical protein V6N13_079781 [Hibiscus sabdariffa]|uniref:Uncharacterized protein n=1 Tax=Hibiscus sabdariffa TaxID=183260 RepID=A0ABR2RSG2_9ROSI
MSITSCFLLFLVCLSLHASSARRLRKAYNTKNTLEKKLHFPIKSDTNTVGVVEAKSHAKGDAGDTQEQEDGVVNHKSVVSVSWRVPHEKRGGKHPGFNVDYSLPKTHPPSHY